MGAFDDAIAAREGAPKGPFDEAVAKREPKHTYSILPVSEDDQGRPHFDSNAGILGAIKRAVTLPGDVYTGKVDPNSPEGTKRAVEFATTFSPVNPAIRAGERAIPGVLRAERPVEVKPPSAEELKGAAEAGYEKARGLGVDYSSNAVSGMATGLQSELEKDGVLAELAPNTFKVIGRLSTPPAGSVAPYVGIEAARRSFGHIARNSADATERMAATRGIEAIDRFLAEPDASSVVAGPAADLAKVAKDARANYAAAKRSEQLQGIDENADLQAASANSGANLDNTIRQAAKNLLKDRKKRQGFSKEELIALDQVARGNTSRNFLRKAGNLLGGGGGLGQLLTSGWGAGAGALAGGPTGAAIGGVVAPAVGMAAKALANRKAVQALEAVDELTRSRSPLFTRMQEEAPTEAISPNGRAALPRALGLSALSGGQERALAELLGEPSDDHRRKKKGRK